MWVQLGNDALIRHQEVLFVAHLVEDTRPIRIRRYVLILCLCVFTYKKLKITFKTRPNALANVVESRTMKVPGWAFLNKFTASSREIFGLYQYFDESRTNLIIFINFNFFLFFVSIFFLLIFFFKLLENIIFFFNFCQKIFFKKIQEEKKNDDTYFT